MLTAVLQIYERLLKALSLKGFKRDLKFILPLSFGILIGIYGFSNFILIALNKVPMITGSAADDFGITFEGDKERGFFSSNRGDARGWDHIYSFEYPTITIKQS